MRSFLSGNRFSPRAEILILLLSACPVYGVGTWIFRPYPSPDGLSFEQVRNITETQDGTIWVASWGNGVAALRGADWKTLTTADGLPGDWVRCVESDGHGGVWIGTADGLCHVTDGRLTAFTVGPISEPSDNSIMCLEQLRDGTLWVGTESGRILSISGIPGSSSGFESPGNSIPVLSSTPPFPGGGLEVSVAADSHETGGETVEGIFQAADGTVWVALNRSGGLRYREGRWTRFGESDGLDSPIRVFVQDPQGTIWAAGWSFLFRLEGDHWTREQSLPDRVFCLGLMPDGMLAAGTESGVWKRVGPDWSRLDLGIEVGEPEITCFFHSSDGSLWIGTQEGLVRGNKPAWTRYAFSSKNVPMVSTLVGGNPGTPPLSFCEDGCLVEFDGEEWVPTFRLDSRYGLPLRLTAPGDGGVWGLHPGRAVRYSLSNGAVTQDIPIPSALRVYQIFQTSRGGILLQTQQGLFRYEAGGWVKIPSLYKDQDEQVQAVDESEDGTLYVCYVEHAERRRAGHAVDLATEIPLFDQKDLHFRSVYCAPDGTVYFAMYGKGLVAWKDGEIHRHTTRNGLLSNHVSTVFQSSDTTLWVGYRRSGIGSYRDGLWINYTSPHGLPHRPVTAFVESPTGVLWAAVDRKGLYRYEPDHGPPEVTIEGAPSEIPYRGFGVFSFSGRDSWNRTLERNLLFSWKIESLSSYEPDPQWSSFTKDRTVIPRRLPPGDYIFHVRAIDEDRNVDPTPASVAFGVAPPFWYRVEFVVPTSFLLVMAFLSLIAVYRKHLALLRSEEELREEEAKMRTLVEYAPEAIVIYDQEKDRFIEANKKAEDLFGLDRKSLLQVNPQSMYPEIQPDGRSSAEIIAEIRGNILNQGEVPAFEWVIRRADGREVPCEVHLVRLPSKDRTLIRASFTDLTLKKKAEIERREFEAQVQQAQKLESLGVLAGGIAHDFNNLLMGILGNAGLALMELPPDSPARANLKDIETAANRAADLTNQMLAYSGKGKFVISAIDLSQLVEEMTRLLGTVISKNAELRIECDDRIPSIEADPTQIRQVIMNLITNASESLGNTPGTIVLRTGIRKFADSELSRFLFKGELREDAYVYLEVQDTGCGMDSQTVKKIFDPFFTTKFTGRGLGLAATLGIVRGHGGSIRVTSSPGEGTTFTVIFPVRPGVGGEEKPKEPEQTDWRGSGLILVADDEEAVRKVAWQTLEKNGFRVLLARDGKEAVDLFRRNADEIRAVLLDLTMPHLNGYEVLKSIREIRNGVPAILSSGYTEEDISERFGGETFSGFIQKPYLPADLIRKLRLILEA